MKFKYKKIIFGITMGTMAIGLATLSVSNKGPTSTTNVENIKASANELPDSVVTQTVPGVNTTADIKTVELKLNAYPEVNDLVKQYFAASVSTDLEALQAIVSEAENIDEKALEKQYEYIEDIKNIDCYTLEGPEEGSYITYVYYEVKFVEIDTLAPGMKRLYICTTEDGSLSVYLSALDNEAQAYIDGAAENAQVVSLINTVNTKLEEVLSKDQKLKEFKEKLEEAARLAAEQAKATEVPVETAVPAETTVQ